MPNLHCKRQHSRVELLFFYDVLHCFRFVVGHKVRAIIMVGYSIYRLLVWMWVDILLVLDEKVMYYCPVQSLYSDWL